MTTPARLRILIVDDNEDDALLVARCIRKGGYEVAFRRVDVAEAMADALLAEEWDAVISDVAMPGFSAEAALGVYHRLECDHPFVVVSGVIGEENAVLLLKAGAHDFVLKGNLSRLVPALEREMREAATRRAMKAAEEALHVSQERYSLAARGANDGLWDWNLADGSVYYSPRWREMLGYGECEVGSCPEAWLERVHPDDRLGLDEAIRLHWAGQTDTFSSEHRICHKDGGWRWVLVRGLAVCDRAGRPLRMAGSLTDITALKTANEQLRQAVAAKTRFLAAASHDLRQPIQAMFCFSAMLVDQLPGHRAHDLAVQLDYSINQLKDLLDSMVDISRLDAGIVSPTVEDVDIQALLTRMAAELAPVAQQAGLSLRCRTRPLTGRSDAVLLGRIVRNLAENALRYTRRGGVLLACRRRQGRVRVEVWDTGIGVPEAMQQHIFEEFFQVGNSERDRSKGLGLGLSIVERLCRMLGHRVEFRSVPGRGSVFSVILAAGEEIRHPGEGDEAGVGQAAGGSIVVIDDDAMVAQAFSRMIANWGFRPLTAGSAEDAVAAVRQAGVLPRAIVADYRLRDGRTGVEAVARLRDVLGVSVPAVIITGDTLPADTAGLPVLQKPVRGLELQQTLAPLM